MTASFLPTDRRVLLIPIDDSEVIYCCLQNSMGCICSTHTVLTLSIRLSIVRTPLFPWRYNVGIWISHEYQCAVQDAEKSVSWTLQNLYRPGKQIALPDIRASQNGSCIRHSACNVQPEHYGSERAQQPAP